MVANKSELIALSKEIAKLEAKRKSIILNTMNGLKKTVPQWACELPLKDFKKALLNLFIESYNNRHGKDYFTWGSTDDIQDDFEWYVKKMIEEGDEHQETIEEYHNGENMFYYLPDIHRFFYLKTFRMSSTSRSSHKTEKYDVNKNGMLVYSYSGTAYHGFGSVDDSVQQELIMDIDKMIVVDYTDSTDEYSPRDSGIHKIKTKFLDGWVDFAKQVAISEKNNKLYRLKK